MMLKLVLPSTMLVAFGLSLLVDSMTQTAKPIDQSDQYKRLYQFRVDQDLLQLNRLYQKLRHQGNNDSLYRLLSCNSRIRKEMKPIKSDIEERAMAQQFNMKQRIDWAELEAKTVQLNALLDTLENIAKPLQANQKPFMLKPFDLYYFSELVHSWNHLYPSLMNQTRWIEMVDSVGELVARALNTSDANAKSLALKQFQIIQSEALNLGQEIEVEITAELTNATRQQQYLSIEHYFKWGWKQYFYQPLVVNLCNEFIKKLK